MFTPKNLLITGHTRSGGHFLMNSISLNFPYYEHHKSGKDFHQRSKLDKKTEDALGEKTNIIQIARQQYWSFVPYKELLDKNWIVLYILRDGKDVMDSLYDMHRKEYKWSNACTIGDFMYAQMSGKSYEQRVNLMPAANPLESWIMHWQSWLAYFKAIPTKIPDNFIRYEELYYYYETTIKKIAEIIGMKPKKIITRIKPDFNSIKPRNGTPEQWKESFSKYDTKYYYNYLYNKVPSLRPF